MSEHFVKGRIIGSAVEPILDPTEILTRELAQAKSLMQPGQIDAVMQSIRTRDEQIAALVEALKRFANLDNNVPSGLWAIDASYCERARAVLAKVAAKQS